MNSRKNLREAQVVSRKSMFKLAELDDHISSARLELYLHLRVAVIASFAENDDPNRQQSSELLSNVLLDMDEAYRESQGVSLP